MACADEKRRFTLSWDIVNFSVFIFSGDGVLTSPAWKTDITGARALWWFLSVYPFESNIRIDLNCLNESGIPDNCEVSIVSSCGEIVQKDATIQYITFELSFEKDLLDSNKIHSKTSQAALTLECKLWQEEMKIEEIRIHSVVEKLDFCWNVTNLGELKSNKKTLYSKITGKDILLVMELNLNSAEVNNLPNYGLCVVVQPVIEGCFSFVVCKVNCHAFPVQKMKGWYNHLRTVFRKDVLLKRKCDNLQLEFIVAHHKIGQIHITHPTSSHIVRTQNMPKDVIGIEPLSEDLLHLFKESIFSDETREKSFSTHRSILASRYACEALVLADRHEDGDLMASIVDFIGTHPEVISSKTWGEMEKNTPQIAAKVTRELFLRK